MTMAEVIAIVISGCSLIITGALTIAQIIIGNRNNNKNLMASLIQEIYRDSLTKTIPEGREYIHYDGEKITGVDKLMDAISSVRRHSLFFKASDRSYYDEIRKKCQGLEDYLNNTTKKYSSSEFNVFLNEVDKEIEDIYSSISDKYSGK